MFNTEAWSKLTEKTYGYKSYKYSFKQGFLYYSDVRNSIGEYCIAPSFGDYIVADRLILDLIDDFAEKAPHAAVQVKVLSDVKPSLRHFLVEPSGYVHRIRYSSYDEWKNTLIQNHFSRMVRQAIKREVTVKFTDTEEDLMEFWRMHSKFRMSKFSKISQPKSYFQNIFQHYFLRKEGCMAFAYDNNGEKIAGVLLILTKDAGFYKFNASKPEFLNLRPNNLLLDEIIRYLDERGIKTLDMGYTGESPLYYGLRRYKLHAGAKEFPRYNLKTPKFEALDRSTIETINGEIERQKKNLILEEDMDLYSRQYYKYFI